MERGREARRNSHTLGGIFDGLGGFGTGGRTFPSLFGGHDPFDDPFFNRPFGSLFRSGMINSDSPNNLQQTSRSKGPIIEELDNDDERLSEANEEDGNDDAALANKNPIIEHPEDQACGNGQSGNNSQAQAYRTNHTRTEGSSGVSFKRVTYGGINGAYYTATMTSRRGENGVKFEESQLADKTTGQATHRITRGIHDKGHSVTRTLDSDGKIGTMQTLHNLEEDDLAGFEQAWKGNADSCFHGAENRLGFSGNTVAGGRSSWEQFGDPFRELSTRNEAQSMDYHSQSQFSRGRPKKIITVNIE